MRIKVSKVDNGKVFIFYNKKYQFVSVKKNWRCLADENGVLINPIDIPTELLIGEVKVEVLDD